MVRTVLAWLPLMRCGCLMQKHCSIAVSVRWEWGLILTVLRASVASLPMSIENEVFHLLHLECLKTPSSKLLGQQTLSDDWGFRKALISWVYYWCREPLGGGSPQWWPLVPSSLLNSAPLLLCVLQSHHIDVHSFCLFSHWGIITKLRSKQAAAVYVWARDFPAKLSMCRVNSSASPRDLWL